MPCTVEVIYEGYEGRKSVGIFTISNELPKIKVLSGIHLEQGTSYDFNLVVKEEDLMILYCLNCHPHMTENAELLSGTHVPETKIEELEKKVDELTHNRDRFKRMYKYFKTEWKKMKKAQLIHEHKIRHAQFKEN